MKIIDKIQDKTGNVFNVQYGISDGQLQNVIDISKTDPEISKICPHDKKLRFPNVRTARSYLSARDVYLLIDSNLKLAGAIWFRKKEWPIKTANSPSHTIVVRIYDRFRGRGLAKPFMKSTINYEKNYADGFTGLWLETDTDNERALNLYLSSGWQFVERDEEHTRQTKRRVLSYTLE